MPDSIFFDPLIESKSSSKWFKEWVPQEVVSTGGKCFHLKWVTEDTLKSLRENSRSLKSLEPDPVVPTTEVLFLCSYEGCGKTFVDSGAIRKHCHIHGERQYSCHYEGCGKKFLDSSKLKRHFLIHTGERDYVCPHEGCGKAFSLDFNLRSHMKTHSQANYHICPFAECGKRYAHEYKLKNHLLTHHEKSIGDLPKYAPPPQRPIRTPKTPSAYAGTSVSSDRPYGCPYEGCEKAYIHEYKLNLHLRREHPHHFQDDTPRTGNNGMDEGSEHDAYATPKSFGGGGGRTVKLSRRKVAPKMPPPPPPLKGKRKPAAPSPLIVKKRKKNSCSNRKGKREPPVGVGLSAEGDSEGTDEDHDIVAAADAAGDRWRYRENNMDDEDETEYED